MKYSTRYDTAQINKFTVDPQTGFVHIKHVPIAQSMVQPYVDSAGKIVHEAKLPSEILASDTVASANHKIVTNDHPSELVTKDNVGKYEAGFTADNAHVEGNKLYNDLTLTDAGLINDVKKGKVELSIGFQTVVVPTPGELNGVHYDAVQKDININHIAVVDRGRAGHSVRLTADSAEAVIPSKEGKQMAEKDNLKNVVDADNSNNSQQSNSNSNSSSSSSSSSSQDPKDKLIAQLQAQVASLTAQLKAKNGNSSSSSNSASDSKSAKNDSLKAEVDALKGELANTQKELSQYKGDALENKIAEKLDLESKVKKFAGDDYDIKDKDGKLKTDKAMKIDAIKAAEKDSLPADFDDKAKKDVYVDTYFDIIQARKPSAKVVGVKTDSKREDSKPDYAKIAKQELAARYNGGQAKGKEAK